MKLKQWCWEQAKDISPRVYLPMIDREGREIYKENYQMIKLIAKDLFEWVKK